MKKPPAMSEEHFTLNGVSIDFRHLLSYPLNEYFKDNNYSASNVTCTTNEQQTCVEYTMNIDTHNPDNDLKKIRNTLKSLLEKLSNDNWSFNIKRLRATQKTGKLSLLVDRLHYNQQTCATQ